MIVALVFFGLGMMGVAAMIGRHVCAQRINPRNDPRIDYAVDYMNNPVAQSVKDKKDL